MKILLKCYVDSQETNHSSGTEGDLHWVKQNRIVLCQTAVQVLTGRHTTTHSASACGISLW